MMRFFRHATLQHHKKLITATFRHWSRDNASMWAASIAFYTMLSLGPLLFVVVTLTGFCMGESAVRDAVMQQIADTVGPGAAEAARSLTDAAAWEGSGLLASMVGLATLLFGASGVFAALQDAMDAVWHVEPKPDASWKVILKRRFLSLAMVAGVGFLLIVSLVAATALAAVQGWLQATLPLAWLPAWMLDTALSLGMLTVAFAAMYKVLPDARLSWRDVWLGGAVTAGLFSVGRIGLAIYFANAPVASAYGAAGSLALILIWVYYAAQIFLLGAEFVRAHLQSRGRMVQPAAHAMAVKTVEVHDRRAAAAGR